MKNIRAIGVLAFYVLASRADAAEILPISAFARLPAMKDVAISPDGRYLSAIQSMGDASGVVVFDLKNNGTPRGVLAEDKDGKSRMRSCSWANTTRLVCEFVAMEKTGTVVFPVTRMVAVNADGTEMKALMQNGRGANSQLHRVLDWTPEAPKTILVEFDENSNGYPEVYELDIYTGRMDIHMRERDPIRRFASDGHGHVRLGSGFENTELSYFARMADEKGWIRLEKFKAFSEKAATAFRPLAVSREGNKVYASGPHEGRDALWEMDLNDRANPVLLFSHPVVDADAPMLAMDGRLLGVYYETDRPFAFYTDQLAATVIESVNKALPAGNFNFIVDYSLDLNSFVIKSSSDVDSGTYYLLDRAASKFARIGAQYPELDKHQAQMARVQSIRYAARDGIEIPGYLTVPVGQRPEKLPLIVLPHGGPTARDTWSFGWLEQFFASRGYAVLQMNFRGSSGYGNDWLMAAHQDWGGLTYDDVTDGARWAIKQGIADPSRICIVGWSFGGYAALLGAVRNSDIYKCSASIAGVSDLIDLEADERAFTNGDIARLQIGTQADKLKADSPRRHAENVGIPLLMVHGDRDYQVDYDHSVDMAAALKKAKKQYKLVRIDGGDHSLSRESQRVTLLTELEGFLKTNIGQGNAAK